MPSGAYDANLQRFVNCADKTLEKDKVYTVHQAALLCGMHPTTVHGYVYDELIEVNRRMPRPKRIVQKRNCGCFDGLVVDPPPSAKGTSRLLPRCVGVAGGSVLVFDGARRLKSGKKLGTAELALGVGIGLLSALI